MLRVFENYQNVKDIDFIKKILTQIGRKYNLKVSEIRPVVEKSDFEINKIRITVESDKNLPGYVIACDFYDIENARKIREELRKISIKHKKCKAMCCWYLSNLNGIIMIAFKEEFEKSEKLYGINKSAGIFEE